ncbi:MAG: hypothetical protein Q8J74_09100, partial [Candidatus Didemnitutus sp.]|nr:hypothetical protein [Candidatus Didemnitutus sp.]
DVWELAHGLSPAVNDRAGDLDGDGLSNLKEYLLGTNPNNADIDGDGLNDAFELTIGTNPRNADTDGDGLPDGLELILHLNPLSAADAGSDTDGDGITDLAEYLAGSDPSDFYNGMLPQLTSQLPADGALGPNDSLSILVTDSTGAPLVNAPVKCIATVGSHLLATAPDGPVAIELTVRSNAFGIVTVFVRGGEN